MIKNRKINFILPYKSRRPAGGFRIMYEYANRLAQRGHDIHIYYPIKTPLMKYRLPYLLRLVLSKMRNSKSFDWFKFDESIKSSHIGKVRDKEIRDADVIIATWWATAAEMGKLSPSKGAKINLIQGFENWEGHEDLLFKSYNMPQTTNVTISNFLKIIVDQHNTSNNAIVIMNAIDTEKYKIARPIEQRSIGSVCMIYSGQEIKGSKYGLEALLIAKEKQPKLVVDLFGIYPPPEGLPKWITYHQNKDVVEIYNKNSIYVSNSLTEGLGLTPLEAMLCGCAVICTDIDGHREFAVDGKNTILVEPKNSQMLADKICFLIENNDQRIALAKQDANFKDRFSWDLAVNKMEDLIQNLCSK